MGKIGESLKETCKRDEEAQLLMTTTGVKMRVLRSIVFFLFVLNKLKI